MIFQRIVATISLLTSVVACQSSIPFPTSDELDESVYPTSEMLTSPRRIEIARIMHLRQLKEPLWLDALVQYDEVYRLEYSSTYHGPMIVRLQRKDDTYSLTARTMTQEESRTASDCVYSPDTKRPWKCALGRIHKEVSRPLRHDEWNEFKKLVSQASFWDLPQVSDRLGHDGAWWTLEGMDADRQHRVSRWSPEPGAYRALCEHMLQASGIDAPRASPLK